MKHSKFVYENEDPRQLVMDLCTLQTIHGLSLVLSNDESTSYTVCKEVRLYCLYNLPKFHVVHMEKHGTLEKRYNEKPYTEIIIFSFHVSLGSVFFSMFNVKKSPRAFLEARGMRLLKELLKSNPSLFIGRIMGRDWGSAAIYPPWN